MGSMGGSIFSKNVFSREIVRSWLFVTFNIVTEIKLEIPQVVQKI